LGEEGVEWLADLFNVILKIAMISQEWKYSTIIPLYKNKEDAQNCNNYRSIKLLNHTMKLWKQVIEGRLRAGIKISENQFGFMSGRSIIEAIHLIRRLMEFYKDRKRDLRSHGIH